MVYQNRALATSLITLSIVCSMPAFAESNEVQAETVRIQSELERLTRRNAWKGVERAYQDLLALGVPLRAIDHLSGEQAARIRGDINAAYDRLSSAVGGIDPTAPQEDRAIADAIVRKTSIENRYGRVSIEVMVGRVPALVRFEWPFAREERVCIENGRSVLADARTYSGFLPIGRYMVDGHFFEVTPLAEAEAETLTIVVKPHAK